MLKTFFSESDIEAGCDEAGRGCLAGPVFAAAVILPREFRHPQLNDSKQLTEHQRDMLRHVVESEALAWAVASVSAVEIDELNILNASLLAMHRALDELSLRPSLLLIDGNRFLPYGKIPHQCVVHGDSTFASIAAASILAKTHRDAYMRHLSNQHPAYGWDRNKGYPTAFHREAIALWGHTPHHRRSFQLLPKGYQGVLFERKLL